MTTLNYVLVLRHARVLPRLFLLLERLGAECLYMKGDMQPGEGGQFTLSLSCPPTLKHRVETQMERLIDVTEVREADSDEIFAARFYPTGVPDLTAYGEAKAL